MQIKTNDIERIKEVIEELEEVANEAIRAKERYNMTLKDLKEDGCNSIEEAGAMIKDLTAKAEKKTKKLNEDFEEFMEDYGEALE